MAFNYFNNRSIIGKKGPKRHVEDVDTARLVGGSLFVFTSFTFTNGTTTGVFGPTQANLLAAYNTSTYPWLNDSSFFTEGEYQGFQKFTIPQTGSYRFTVKGGGGGQKSHLSYRSGTWQPFGAQVIAVFNFEIGDKIQLLVGHKGEDDNTYYPTQNYSSEADNAGPGGGGGSFVFIDKDDTYPLIAAGGGAGGSRNTYANANASTSANAHPGQTSTSTNTGTNGNGHPGYTGGASYWSGGGAGWLTNGTGGNSNNSYNYIGGSSSGQGGRAPRNGGFGGEKGTDGTNSGGDGGFGGGGGGYSDNVGTGGGGGYSGGAGGNSTPNNSAGGGGGSYVNTSGQTTPGVATAVYVSSSISLASSNDHGSILVELI